MHERNVDCLFSTLCDKMVHSKEMRLKSMEEAPKHIDLEEVIKDLSGVFQTRIFLLLILLIAPAFALNNVTQFLILLEPEHQCKTANSEQSNDDGLYRTQEQRTVFSLNTGLKKSCELKEETHSQTVNCINGYVYNYSFIYSTLVSENNWVCEHEWITYFVHTIYWTGSLFGVICIGFVSDRYGRVVAIIVCHMIAVICGTLTVFAATNFAALLFLRAMMGFVVLSQGAVSFLYVIEYMDTKRRNLVSNMYLISFAVTFALTPLIAFYARNWRLLSIVTSAPAILIAFIFALLPESVRWLKTRNTEQMIATLKRVAVANGKQVSETVLNSISITKEDEAPLQCILKHKILLILFVNTSIIWFLQSMTYTASTTYASNSSDNPFISLSICSLLDIIAALVSNYTADVFGRKPSTIVSAFTASIAYMSTIFISESEMVAIIAMTFVGRLLQTIGHNVHYLYAVEVYPTVIRGRALSLRMAIGSVGNLLSPQIMLLNVYCKQLALLVIGICCLISGIVMFYLPETKDVHLPQTLDDMSVFDSKHTVVKSVSETVAVK